VFWLNFFSHLDIFGGGRPRDAQFSFEPLLCLVTKILLEKGSKVSEPRGKHWSKTKTLFLKKCNGHFWLVGVEDGEGGLFFLCEC
jgi:hypothetical protein